MKSKIMQGNCLKTLKTLPDNSVDSIVTDPPYELGFMGKSWDATGIAFNVDVWQECLRVLKPGGHLLAFSGSRTYHRMACAIEDAGFQIRDQIMWVYGSGFPKSLNIGKAMDKAAGAERYDRVVEMRGKSGSLENPIRHVVDAGKPATAEAEQWGGWGTALKPAHEPIVLARKPLVGTVANNVLVHGVGGINIDVCRVAHASEADRASATPQGRVTVNNVGNMPDVENGGRKELARPDTSLGRFPANFIHDGSDEVLQLFPDKAGAMAPVKAGQKGFGGDIYGKYAQAGDDGATFYNDGLGSAARFFYCAKASKKERNAGLDGFDDKPRPTMGNGIGGQPNQQIANNKNHHPTVKPLDLMRYLCKLVTPPSGIVLDPFTGSGSTLVAAKQCGYKYIGCELDKNYIKIARARLKNARKLTRKI